MISSCYRSKIGTTFVLQKRVAQKDDVIPISSPRSKFAVTLVASHLEHAFIDLIANSILRATIPSLVVKIAFRILSSTMSKFPCQSFH